MNLEVLLDSLLQVLIAELILPNLDHISVTNNSHVASWVLTDDPLAVDQNIVFGVRHAQLGPVLTYPAK